MEKLHTNNMTVVHLASGASKPLTPFAQRKVSINKILDPSSSLRSDRYPIPGSITSRFEPVERNYAQEN